MKRILLSWFLITHYCLVGYGQPYIVACPLDTNSLFEIDYFYSQFIDSTGKLQSRVCGYATPNWFAPEAFFDEQTRQPCTPFEIEFVDDKIYIYDYTKHYHSFANRDSANRYLLNQNNVNSLKVHIINETKESLDLNHIPFLNDWNLRVGYLTINCSYENDTKIKIGTRKWTFLQPEYLLEVKILANPKENKKKLLHAFGRFKTLEMIQVPGQYIYK